MLNNMNNTLPYTFDDEKGSIGFSRFDLPAPWINYLSNGRFHAFVSQAGGGMAWWRTPMLFRLTRYRYYNLPIDTPGFYIYIRMKDGAVWSPTFRPCVGENASASHAAGYSTFSAEKNGLRATLTLFVPPDHDALVWSLELKNQRGEEVECDVFAYAELSQFMYQNEVILGYYLKWNVQCAFDKELSAVMYRYNAWMHPLPNDCPAVFFSSSEKVDSYCCNRDTFCGNYRDEQNPVEVERGRLSNTDMNGGEACAALHSYISLKANGEKRINYFLGVAAGALVDYEGARKAAKDTLASLKAEGAVDAQFEKCKAWWREHLGVYKCEIPDADAQRMINIWNPIQSVVTARYSRSVSSTASGIRGIGFRDTCQDMLAQAYRKPEWAKQMLLYLCTQQFEDGHPVHQSWPEENKLPQDVTRSDNHIWMVYLAYAIAAETGDISFLEEKVPFLGKDMCTPVQSASVWEHLLRGIQFTEEHMGAHGLPLILFSDWNDHLGPFGRKGKGETIFVSEQLIYALKQLTELAKLRGENALIERFASLMQGQEEALKKYAWDGEWYLRGIDDDGQPVGSHTAKNARIWVNTQSWMVIAGAGEREKNICAMDSVRAHLDTDLGILINSPGYPLEGSILSHKVNGLPAGYSENAGVFCQANCWAIMAEALLGRGDLAWKYYKQVMPHEVIKRIGIERYKNEAYAYSSTMLGNENAQFGQACVSQVTGTAAWMDVVATQYLLGIRPELKGLCIDPCIPADWKGFTVKRKYRGCELTIGVENPNGVQHGVKELYIEGEIQDISMGAYILSEKLKSDRAHIRAVMG